MRGHTKSQWSDDHTAVYDVICSVVTTVHDYLPDCLSILGPHGGAFGNIFFCDTRATVIEFNVPWVYGEWLDGLAPIRDLFYSTVRQLL